MANLKGGNWDKNIRDLNFKLAAFKERRNGTNSHRTHSEATRVKRQRYVEDFKQFAEDNELEGKFNQLMNDANMAEFLAQRLEGLSYSTQEDYIRGWSGMVQGLQQVNVTVPLEDSFFNAQLAEYREIGEHAGPSAVNTNITPQEVISQLPESSSVIAQLQHETGYRVSEAYTVIYDVEKYLDGLKLKAVQGKGGQMVREKIISLELRLSLLKMHEQMWRIPHQSTYYRHLQPFGYSSHTIRAFSIKELYTKKVQEEGLSHTEACLFVSKEVNHHRISVVEYYLSKFGGVL